MQCGAEVRKAFTIDNSLEGADHAMSANPLIFRKMVDMCDDFLRMYGSRRLNEPYDCEAGSTILF